MFEIVEKLIPVLEKFGYSFNNDECFGYATFSGPTTRIIFESPNNFTLIREEDFGTGSDEFLSEFSPYGDELNTEELYEWLGDTLIYNTDFDDPSKIDKILEVIKDPLVQEYIDKNFFNMLKSYLTMKDEE